jgi:nuclear pore complex protein Nup188
MFAWAILTWKLTTRANYDEQERELLLESPDASYVSLPTSSALEQPASAIMQLETHELFDNVAPYQHLAEICSSNGVLAIINQLVETALPAFGTHVDKVSRDRIRLLFLQLLRAGLGNDILGYVEDLILTTYTILAGDRAFRAWVDEPSCLQADPVVSYFLEDEDVLRPQLFDIARQRFPAR